MWTKIWQPICAICGSSSNTSMDLCDICYSNLPWIKDSCYQCGLPLTTAQESVRCNQCQYNPPEFDRFCALFTYQSPVTKLIRQLKFNHNLAYGNLMGQLLLEQYDKWYKSKPAPEVVVPVPLHEKRIRSRGFNQVQEILRPLVKAGKITVLNNICERTQYTRPQAKLNFRHRKYNLQKAFRLTQKVDFEHVAIVDDVLTTGNTVRGLSRVFRDAGVQCIDVWCVCRA